MCDTLLLYFWVAVVSRVILTESASNVSIGESQGELVINGYYTVIGWRDASTKAISNLNFGILLHLAFSTHNYLANVRK